jgi:hypothetical protein
MSESLLFSLLLTPLLLLPGLALLAGAWARVRVRPAGDGMTARMRALSESWGCRVAPWPAAGMPQVLPGRLGSEACVAEVDGRRLAVVWMDAVELLEDRGTDWVVARADGSPRVVAHARSEVEVWREMLGRLGGVEGSAMLVAPSGFRWPSGRPVRGVVGEERLGDALGLARRLTASCPVGPWPPFPAPEPPPRPGMRAWALAGLQGTCGVALLLAGLALAVAGGEWARALGRLFG